MTPARNVQKYGGPHKALRKRLAQSVEAGLASCWRCGMQIRPGERWDLGHRDDGNGWAGPEHRECNRAAGAKIRNEMYELVPRRRRARALPEDRFGGLPDPTPDDTVDRWSRHWCGPFNPRCPRCRELGGPCPDADR